MSPQFCRCFFWDIWPLLLNKNKAESLAFFWKDIFFKAHKLFEPLEECHAGLFDIESFFFIFLKQHSILQRLLLPNSCARPMISDYYWVLYPLRFSNFTAFIFCSDIFQTTPSIPGVFAPRFWTVRFIANNLTY